MWTRCFQSGSRCWTSTCGPRPADPEPQRQPGDISDPPRGPALPGPLETWSGHHAPFSLTMTLLLMSWLDLLVTFHPTLSGIDLHLDA